MVKWSVVVLLIGLVLFVGTVNASADPRVEWGRETLTASLEQAGYAVGSHKGVQLIVRIDAQYLPESAAIPEGYRLSVNDRRIEITGYDAAGVLYGCLDLAERIHTTRRLPESLDASDCPAMNLRGTCILLMKLGTYNYPITPEEFPFFYDKVLWLAYLDFLAVNRFNYVAFWNGHPFDYFMKLSVKPLSLVSTLLPQDVS